MHGAARLELLVSTIAHEPMEIDKAELLERLRDMGIDKTLLEDTGDSLWDLYLILRERSGMNCR